MKKLSILLLIFSLAMMATAQQSFEVITKNPTPGSVITIEYMPRNTVLQGVKNFEATAYLLEGKLPLAKSIVLKQEGGIYRGTVKTNDTTRAVFFSFAKDDVQDNNNDEGYYTALYDKKGNIIAGANNALAVGFINYYSIWGLKRNVEKAAELNKKEFENPASRAKFYNEYFTYLSQSKDEADKELLKTELQSHLAKKDLSEADMMKAKNLFENALKDKEKGAAILAQVKERYPTGNWKRGETLSSFQKAKTLQDKEARYNEIIATLAPFTKDEQPGIDNFSSTLARMYSDSGNYDAAMKYASQIKSNTMKASVLNAGAFKLAGQGIDKKPIDIKKGLELSKQALALIEEEKKTLANKTSYISEKQHLKNLNNTYHSYRVTYATLLYHKGDHEQAYVIQKAAVDNFDRKNINLNESFALLTEKVKGPKQAQAALEKFFEDGKYTPAMKEQLMKIYTAAGNSEAQWTSYIGNLEEMAYNKLKAELAKKMINIPAPQFALKDMDGKEVALSTLKGKVVVVDFWATWCGPCIASFPGMQKTVSKFKDNPDVVFLFIDTWENDSNRVQKVTDFIAKNKYTFHVLYDDAKAKEGNEFVVVENFKVEGIPTKFVIDRNNNIRFKSVGYNGSADAIVSELTAMIDMAEADSGGPVKKGF